MSSAKCSEFLVALVALFHLIVRHPELFRSGRSGARTRRACDSATATVTLARRCRQLWDRRRRFNCCSGRKCSLWWVCGGLVRFLNIFKSVNVLKHIRYVVFVVVRKGKLLLWMMRRRGGFGLLWGKSWWIVGFVVGLKRHLIRRTQDACSVFNACRWLIKIIISSLSLFAKNFLIFICLL